MRNVAKHALRWLVLYLLVVAVPLWMMLIGEQPPARSFWVEFGVAIGFVGLALMCVQFLLTGRFYQVGKPFGVDTILQFHRQAGIVGFTLILGHVIVLLLARPSYLAFFDPRVNAPRAAALVLVLLALGALVLLSVRRRTFGLSYEWWRLTHAGFAALVVVIGLAHVNMVGHYVSTPLRRGVWIAGVLAALGLLLHIRVIKPLAMRKRPWRVAEVKAERNESWSITLEAVDHTGMPFQPGQYAWLTIGDHPLALQQHPFSFSSSAADPRRVRFTIKELGDFTDRIGETPLGARAFLEGPYGRFVAEPDRPTVMIAGGIGITPFVSMLRTAADRESHDPFHLFYGVPTWDRAILREELAELERTLPGLTVTYVVDRPDDNWTGERGYVTRDVLDRHLPPEDREAMSYLACGPDPMLDAVHAELTALGVPRDRQRSERFNMV